jgi:hypothetical protein
MGGLACAKTIIDQRNALVQTLDCMIATIYLNQDISPTVEQMNEFVDAANGLATVAGKIEFYVREGGEAYGDDDHKRNPHDKP